MSVVFTETTCGKCRKVVKEEGVGFDGLPRGWGQINLSIYQGEGVVRQHIVLDLCPSCTRETLKFLGVPRKRTRRAPGTKGAGTGPPSASLETISKVSIAQGSIVEVDACAWATGLHQHRIEGEDDVCLAPAEQWRLPDEKPQPWLVVV